VDKLDSVADALGVHHLLQFRVGFAETEVLRADLLADEVSNEDRRDVVMVAHLWSRGEPASVWEATAAAPGLVQGRRWRPQTLPRVL